MAAAAGEAGLVHNPIIRHCPVPVKYVNKLQSHILMQAHDVRVEPSVYLEDPKIPFERRIAL